MHGPLAENALVFLNGPQLGVGVSEIYSTVDDVYYTKETWNIVDCKISDVPLWRVQNSESSEFRSQRRTAKFGPRGGIQIWTIW
jgi:hypothetical protein